MEYITDKKIAQAYYQGLADRLYVDRSFDEGVLKFPLKNKVWLEFDNILTPSLFSLFGDMARICDQPRFIIADPAISMDRYFDDHGVFPMAFVGINDTFIDMRSGPQGNGLATSLGFIYDTFVIFHESFNWLLYCNRSFEVAMLLCFEPSIYSQVEAMVKTTYKGFGYEDILTIEEYFDPIWYDYLNKKQIEDLIALYK